MRSSFRVVIHQTRDYIITSAVEGLQQLTTGNDVVNNNWIVVVIREI